MIAGRPVICNLRHVAFIQSFVNIWVRNFVNLLVYQLSIMIDFFLHTVWVFLSICRRYWALSWSEMRLIDIILRCIVILKELIKVKKTFKNIFTLTLSKSSSFSLLRVLKEVFTFSISSYPDIFLEKVLIFDLYLSSKDFISFSCLIFWFLNFFSKSESFMAWSSYDFNICLRFWISVFRLLISDSLLSFDSIFLAFEVF